MFSRQTSQGSRKWIRVVFFTECVQLQELAVLQPKAVVAVYPELPRQHT